MYQRTFDINSISAVASATKSAAGITGGTTVNPNLYEWRIGSDASPADNAIGHGCQRYTAAGTPGATPTPAPTSGLTALAAAIATAGTGQYSGEPTYTAGKVVIYLALNQRSTHVVQLHDQAPIVIPATANNGLGFYPVHASFTGNVDYDIKWAE